MLLIGGTGFIGTHLAAALRASGHEVFVTSSTELRGSGVIEPNNRLDFSDPTKITTLFDRTKPDIVFHLASRLVPSSPEAEYYAERDTVFTPMIRLAKISAERNTKFVYFSSGGAIYGRTEKVLLDEDHVCCPISYYGQSKLEAESYLSFLQRVYGLNCLILRPSNPYGVGQSLAASQGLISVLLGKALSGQALEIWGGGLGTRDYIYIDDLVRSICGLLDKQVYNGTFNIGSGVGYSILDVLQIVEEIVGSSIPVTFKAPRPTDVPHVVLDVSRIRSVGALAQRPLAEGVRKYAELLGILNG